MTELRLKRSEIRWSAFGTLLTALTIIIGVIQYTLQQSHENTMEFKRSVWNKQMEVYTQACRYAGIIANNADTSDTLYKSNVKAFGALYWGEMIIVEDPAVEKAMKDFYEAVYDFVPDDQQAANKLKYKANMLAKACKLSSHETWNALK